MPDALPEGNMTHEEITERNIVDLYVLGKLPPEESARFEEHFVDCPICLENVEMMARFHAGIKPLAAIPARRTGYGWSGWAAAAAVMLALGSTLFFAVREAGLRRQLEQARAASSGWRQRYEGERAAAAGRSSAASTFLLTISRGAAADGSEPVNRVTLPATPGLVVLSLEGEADGRREGVRARITDSTGREVWRLEGVQATPRETLSLIVPSEQLHPGDYLVTVEGLSADRERYRFRAY